MIFLGTAIATEAPLLKGASLAAATAFAAHGAIDSKREALLARIAAAERTNQIEAAIYEAELAHQERLAQLTQVYGSPPGDVFAVPDSHAIPVSPAPQLPGGHIHQPTLPTGAGRTQGATSQGPPVEQPGETVEFFNLQWLLESNSAHCLLVGDTGSGKTTLARHLIEALGAEEVQVLDADDDDRTWKGYPVVGEGDDWKAIDAAMGKGLEEFKRRKPNAGNPVKVWVFEEMPDLIAETKTGKEFISRLARRGRKRQVFALGITQDANSSEIELSQPVQKCFTRIFLQSMAQWALVNVANRQQRQFLAAALATCTRPALVEFKGNLYPWDVPSLANAATAANATPVEVVTDGEDPSPTLTAIAREFAPMLEASLAEPEWAAHLREVCGKNQGQCSVRDFQRSPWARRAQFSAEDVRGIFATAHAIEVGTCLRDGDGEIIGFSLSP